MKVIVGKCIAGVQLNLYAIKELIKRGSKLIDAMPAEHHFGKEIGTNIEAELKKYVEEELRDAGDGFLAEKWPDDMIYTLYKDGVFYTPHYEEQRDDKIAIEFFEEVGVDKVGRKGITIVEIPDGIEWELCAGDDGWEWIAEKHRKW